MRSDKVTFLDIIIFIGGLYWVFTTENSETFWTISISLLLGLIAKSYLIYKAKKDNSSKEKEGDGKYRIEIKSDNAKWFKNKELLEFSSQSSQVETTINFLTSK